MGEGVLLPSEGQGGLRFGLYGYLKGRAALCYLFPGIYENICRYSRGFEIVGKTMTFTAVTES